MTPIVSLLMSIRNGEGELRRTLACLRSQTLADFELLLMNDGSTDRTGAMLDELAQRDARIRVFHHAESKGLTKSLNELLHHAKGRYIAREDCGDFALPDRFASQVAHLDANPGHVAVASDYWIISEEEEVIGVRRLPTDPARLRAILHESNPVCHSTLMIRRDVLQSIGGYDETMRLAQDYDLLLRLLQRGELGVVPQPLEGYYYAPTGLTFRNLRTQLGYMALAQHRHLGRPQPERIEFDPLSADEAAARYHVVIGRMLLAKCRPAEARKHLGKALALTPGDRIAKRLYWATNAPAFLLRWIKALKPNRDEEPRPQEPTTLEIPRAEEL